MYKVIIDKINFKKQFNSFYGALAFVKALKLHYENLIEKIDYRDERRLFFIDLYWNIKIEKVLEK